VKLNFPPGTKVEAPPGQVCPLEGVKVVTKEGAGKDAGRIIWNGSCALVAGGGLEPMPCRITQMWMKAPKAGEKPKDFKCLVNWLYPPGDERKESLHPRATAKKPVFHQAEHARELFFSFHQDVIDINTVYHPAQVLFLPALPAPCDLPAHYKGFVCWRTYDAGGSKRLFSLSDGDYTREKAKVVKGLVQYKRGELAAAHPARRAWLEANYTGREAQGSGGLRNGSGSGEGGGGGGDEGEGRGAGNGYPEQVPPPPAPTLPERSACRCWQRAPAPPWRLGRGGTASSGSGRRGR